MPTPPVIGFTAYRSNTGKTTLLTRVLPLLTARGLRVGLVKHAHHRFDIDIPGKDSYELRKAGACQVLVTSAQRWALMVETPQVQGDPQLDEALQRLDATTLDLVLVEGFRHAAYPKIELRRAALDSPLLYTEDPHIIAVATDEPLALPPHLTLLDINDAQAVADFVVGRLPG